MPRFNIHIECGNVKRTYPFISPSLEVAMEHCYTNYGEQAWDDGEVSVEIVKPVRKQKFG